jgi:hypothetical protein
MTAHVPCPSHSSRVLAMSASFLLLEIIIHSLPRFAGHDAA